MPDILVSGVSLIVIILGLVEFAKKLGLSGNILTVASMLIGIALGVLFKLAAMYPAINPWFEVAVFGLACGLAACGIYDFVKARTEPLK